MSSGRTINNATLYRLPRSRLKRDAPRLDWIDDYESLIVDIDFCTWLAIHYSTPSPVTDDILASDLDADSFLYRWNLSFAHAMTTGETDAFDGMIGGDSPTDLVACFDTWMTQRQASNMWMFFRSSIRGDHIVVENRSGS